MVFTELLLRDLSARDGGSPFPVPEQPTFRRRGTDRSRAPCPQAAVRLRRSGCAQISQFSFHAVGSAHHRRPVSVSDGLSQLLQLLWGFLQENLAEFPQKLFIPAQPIHGFGLAPHPEGPAGTADGAGEGLVSVFSISFKPMGFVIYPSIPARTSHLDAWTTGPHRTLKAGACAFLQKPADNNELLDVIRTTLNPVWPGTAASALPTS
jgi:hypothetical protein